MPINRFVGIFTLFLLAGCASSVVVDYDTSRQFGHDKTFSWAPAESTSKSAASEPVVGGLIIQRVESSVNEALIEKGYRKTEDANPDLLVAAYITTETKYEQDIRPVGGTGCCYGGSYRRVGGWRGYGAIGYEVDINAYKEASLYIDIIDAKTKRAAWRGVLTRRVFGRRSPQEMNDYIDHCVTEILSGFPRVGVQEMPRPE